MSGDVRQAAPVGEEVMYKRGRYEGKGLNKPRNKEAPADAPSMEFLTSQGELFREEFDDCVVLRNVHRVDKREKRVGAQKSWPSTGRTQIGFLM